MPSVAARSYPLDAVKAAVALYVIREEREDATPSQSLDGS